MDAQQLGLITQAIDRITALITSSGGGLSNKVPYTGATQSVDLGTFFLTTSRLIGGSAVNSSVDFYSTTGAGTGTAFTFRGGNNGATLILTMLNDGTLRIPNNRQFQGTDSGGTNRAIITWSAGDNITLTGSPGVSDIVLNPTSAGVGLYVKSGGDIGLGTSAPSARAHVIKTTEQLRVGYDVSNYANLTVGSTGIATFNGAGAASKFVFSKNIELTQTVTTEVVVSDTTVTIVINGTTYKLLARA